MRSGPRHAPVVSLLAWAVAAGVLTAAYPSHTPASEPPPLDRLALIADLAALADPALEGRRTGSPGGLRARAWVEGRFSALGLRPAGSAEYLQTFSFTVRRLSGIFLPGPFRRHYRDAANVVARLDGAEPSRGTFVISAHYDHLGVHDGVIYPGADDNASGVAALLAVARAMKAVGPRHPMLFVAFDAEELGLHGARAFVGSRGAQGVALNVNLDMLSRSSRHEIFAAGTHHTPGLRPIVASLQAKTPVGLRFGHDTPDLGRDDWTTLSDHGVFHEAGVPFLYFGVEDHEDYHQPTDTVDKIDRQFFAEVTTLIVDAVLALDQALP